jgi:two-component sensor histidine kinase
MQVGFWLGWVSIVVVLLALAFDVHAPHRWLLIGATLAAAAGNSVVMVIPWRDWLPTPRGQTLLDLWCGGVIAFVALLVASAGSSFALLLFLAVPFISVVQVGWRRGFWLVVSASTCAVVAASIPLSAGATAMRLALVAAVAAVAVVLSKAIRGEAVARKLAVERAELERTRTLEANHRIKNDLQAATDLLLLGRPAGSEGAAFDDTAARIRSIATVHRLLTESEDRVEGAILIRSITANTSVPVTVEADAVAFDAATAQRVGIVTNELVTNALRHGTPPIVVRLDAGTETRLRVDDGGSASEDASGGLGLDLVQWMVEHGLAGRFELRPLSGGGTRAEVVFPTVVP